MDQPPVDALQALPNAARESLALAGRLAAEAGHQAYLVGGAIRDLLLNRPVGELDVVIVGDAIAVAESFAAVVSGQLVRHDEFGTATVHWGSLALDFVTARRERYSRAGALPEVTSGNIEEDLRRRDFTINSLAAAIAPSAWGMLLDPTSGLADLRARLVRVHHERSFQDDATRLLRAVRHEQRLGFVIEPATEGWLRRDAVYLDTISGDRLRHELDRWWRLEDSMERVFARAESLGLWGALCSGFRYTEEALGPALLASRGLGGTTEALRQRGLALWTWTLPEGAADTCLDRLRVPSADQRACHDAWLLRDRLEEVPSLANSAVARLLAGLHTQAITAAWLLAPLAARVRIDQYRHQLRDLRPMLRAPDLEQLGVPRGPALGRFLQLLQDARWDGLAHTRDDEERLVLQWLSEPLA